MISDIPLLVHLPGSKHAGETRDQLTQNIDIFPTILDYHNVPCSNPVTGLSWKDTLENNADKKENGKFIWNLEKESFKKIFLRIKKDNLAGNKKKIKDVSKK